MKIVLCAMNSSYTHTNPAVRILADALSLSHDVKIIETTVNARGGIISYTESLFAEKADMYAFSVYIWNRAEQLSAAKTIKALCPESLILLGGPEVSFESPAFLSENPFADFLIRGEGEKAICEIADGKHPRGSIVDGGVFDGFTKSREPYYNGNHLTGEDYAGKLVYYESSRGCPYGCSYCLSSVKRQGERVRAKDSDAAINEICMLMSHGVRAVKLVDRTFNFDRERAKKIFKGIIEFAEKYTKDGMYHGSVCHFEICAALLDDETVEILKDAPAGLFRFEIGVQTTTKETLFAIGRNDDTEKIIENVKKLRENTKITLHLDLICGLPLDTFDGIKTAFDKIYGLSDCLQMGFLKLLPGTSLRNDAEKYGMIYLSRPPYTVLSTSTITFDEMKLLRKVADCAEKFSDTDSGFRYSAEYLTGKSDSPFEMYKSLALFLAGIGNPSQRTLYTALFDFGKKQLAFNDSCADTLREYLRFDFLLSNSGKAPSELERKYTEGQQSALSQIKHKFIHELPKNPKGWFVPALEAHIFGFDNRNVYIIDRKNRRFETRTLI